MGWPSANSITEQKSEEQNYFLSEISVEGCCYGANVFSS